MMFDDLLFVGNFVDIAVAGIHGIIGYITYVDKDIVVLANDFYFNRNFITYVLPRKSTGWRKPKDNRRIISYDEKDNPIYGVD